jgi:hypothetical protein
MALAVILAASGAAAKDACFRYEPARTTLEGKVYIFDAFGPPGFGENPEADAKETYFGLTFISPICVRGRPGDPVNSQTEWHVGVVQLVVPDALRPRIASGEGVRLTGVLFHGFTGHHHSDVLMDVTKVETVGPQAGKAAK